MGVHKPYRGSRSSHVSLSETGTLEQCFEARLVVHAVVEQFKLEPMPAAGFVEMSFNLVQRLLFLSKPGIIAAEVSIVEQFLVFREGLLRQNELNHLA